jgi:hypothetical protein
MKFKNLFLMLILALIFSAGAFVTSTEAQTRRIIRPVVVYRPVYVRPFRVYRYYDPFWAERYKSPYERFLEERYYAQRELEGNVRELARHREKYGRDGVITAKERRELEDDVRDVAKARAKLARFNRYY